MRFALLFLFVFAVPTSAAEEDMAYYPMKVGTKWTYKLNDQEMIVTATSAEKVGMQDCVKFEFKLKDRVVGTEHNAILKDGVYRFKFSDDAIEPAICFFKATAKKGEPWTQDFMIGDAKATGKYEMDTEDVEVPAGKYEKALLVRGEAIEKAGDATVVTKTTMWYVKNVGMVKQVITKDGLRIVVELQKMEEPGK